MPPTPSIERTVTGKPVTAGYGRTLGGEVKSSNPLNFLDESNPLDYLLVYAYRRGTPRIFTPSGTLALGMGSSAIIDYLAAHPKAGVIMQGTGGIRKLRWAREGMGKSSGVRNIYYYHDEYMPLYLWTIFGKGERDNLTRAEQNALRRLVRTLIETRRKHHG
jgi:hypothetical protein